MRHCRSNKSCGALTDLISLEIKIQDAACPKHANLFAEYPSLFIHFTARKREMSNRLLATPSTLVNERYRSSKFVRKSYPFDSRCRNGKHEVCRNRAEKDVKDKHGEVKSNQQISVWCQRIFRSDMSQDSKSCKELLCKLQYSGQFSTCTGSGSSACR